MERDVVVGQLRPELNERPVVGGDAVAGQHRLGTLSPRGQGEFTAEIPDPTATVWWIAQDRCGFWPFGWCHVRPSQ